VGAHQGERAARLGRVVEVVARKGCMGGKEVVRTRFFFLHCFQQLGEHDGKCWRHWKCLHPKVNEGFWLDTHRCSREVCGRHESTLGSRNGRMQGGEFGRFHLGSCHGQPLVGALAAVEDKAEVQRFLADLGNNAVVGNGDLEVQKVDWGVEFIVTHAGVLENFPSVVVGFNVSVGRHEPGSKTIIKAATAEWRVFPSCITLLRMAISSA
jgi:hypothetical protein